MVTKHNDHCRHRSLVAVTVDEQAQRPVLKARALLGAPLGGSDDGDASCHSSSDDVVASLRDVSVHAGVTRGRPSLS